MHETTTHTPLRLGLYPSDVFDARGNIYASTYGNKDRAAHIVKCVNAHDALVTALRDVKKRIESSKYWWMGSPDRGGFDVDMIDAALTNADKPDHA